MGFINAVYADSFDAIAVIPTFVLTPLIYLGGVFYSINILPDIWRNISLANPMLYVVNTFREGMLGSSDVSIPLALGISVLEISIPSDSKYTIESKSMKLFLNSFFNKNFAKQAEVINILTKRISKKCNSEVKIVSRSSFKTFDRNNFSNQPGLLVYKGFRSICPVTSQPDWGNIYIYSSTNTLNKTEIYNFLFSLRNHGGFHEHCIEKIFLYIKETFSVDHLEICGRFLRRGGIDINPIRSSQKKLFFTNFREFNQ